MTPISKPRVSQRIGSIAESATLAVDAKAKGLKAAGENVIGFGAGEPDFPTPAHIVDAAAAACRDEKNHRYTPAAGLPESEVPEFASVVRSVRDQHDAGVLLIDHNMSLILDICDRIHVLDQGTTLAEGTPAEIRENLDVAAAYLGESAVQEDEAG